MLDRIERDPDERVSLRDLKRLHYLYERTSADLGRIITFASEPELRRYLESLVARAYGEIHETREKPHRFAPLRWFLHTFPQTFRRRLNAFWVSVAVTMVGILFGLFAVALDPDAKAVLLPFGHGEMTPSERVKMEEKIRGEHLSGQKTAFASQLMTHNTRVSIFALATGMTWAVGTLILLFYNGIILGGICIDYILDGQLKFLAGWLLPHGSVEIPAILIAGQAGLILGTALIGWGGRTSVRARLRAVTADLVTLIGGVAVLLIWAGIVEAFFSQYHEPVIPYSLKAGFGLAELLLLGWFLARSGKDTEPGMKHK